MTRKQSRQVSPSEAAVAAAAQALSEHGVTEGQRLYFVDREAGQSPRGASLYAVAFYVPQGSLILNVTHLAGALLGYRLKRAPAQEGHALYIISEHNGRALGQHLSQALAPEGPSLFLVSL